MTNKWTHVHTQARPPARLQAGGRQASTQARAPARTPAHTHAKTHTDTHTHTHTLSLSLSLSLSLWGHVPANITLAWQQPERTPSRMRQPKSSSIRVISQPRPVASGQLTLTSCSAASSPGAGDLTALRPPEIPYLNQLYAWETTEQEKGSKVGRNGNHKAQVVTFKHRIQQQKCKLTGL
jgi:hypothetical protein